MGGEHRRGQDELAEAVSDAITRGHHLLAEAPTGSGKSLAYLAPAVASGLKVVVATSTIALQTQLVTKDLPSVEQHGRLEFGFALLKGRRHYLCRAKLRAANAPDALFEHQVGRDFGRNLEVLQAFAERSQTGDRAELADAINDASWNAVSCSSVECPGRAECADSAECFAEHARAHAHDASVLVVNHALLCADLASGGHVLPEHDVVVLDEAHAFASNARDAFADEITAESLARLAPVLARSGVPAATADAVSTAARALGKTLENREGRVHIGDDDELDQALLHAAERLARASAALNPANTEYAKRAASVAAGRLETLRRLAAPGPDDVVWVERGTTRRLRLAPVAVGETIAHRLLSQQPVIAISATLGGEPPFTALAGAMGFDTDAALGGWGDRDDEGMWTSNAGRGYRALRTSSTFDWRAQGMLYVAKDLPEPKDRDAWVAQAGERLCDLVNAAGGRTLVLCTALANVERFAEVLRSQTDHTVLMQGERDTGRLTQDFLEDETSVLVGSRSLWAGIDAAGAACVLVVIDKIPFPVPDEPLHAARRERAEQAGLSPFFAIDVPDAALLLAQGVGRLIRRVTDRGVVAVLDRRLAVNRYREQLLAALPPLRRSIDLDDVCAFLREVAADLPARANARGREHRTRSARTPARSHNG